MSFSTFRFGLAESDDRRLRNIRSLFSSSDRIRAWGIKSAVSLVDQALTSGTNLGVNILLALWLHPVAYGAFAVAFAAYLFLAALHNALVLEPSVVIGPARHAQQLRAYFRAQMQLHALLVWPLTGLALTAALALSWVAPHAALISALTGGGLALPLLLLLWLARRMCYVLHKPGVATVGSSVHLIISLGNLLVLRFASRLTPSTAFFALGLGSLAGSCLILRLTALGDSGDFDDSFLSWRIVLSENWRYGRWLAGSALFYAVSTSVQIFLAAGILGLDSAGILRAMQIPSLVMTQIIASLGLLVLPALSYDFGNGRIANLRQKAKFVSLGLGLLAFVFVVFLTLIDVPLERLLFREKYTDFTGMIPLLALIPATNGLCSGLSLALRACQMPHCDLVSNASGAVVSLASAVVLIPTLGVFGAGVSMVLGAGVMNVVTFSLYLRFAKRFSAPAGVQGTANVQDCTGLAPPTRHSPQPIVQDYV